MKRDIPAQRWLAAAAVVVLAAGWASVRLDRVPVLAYAAPAADAAPLGDGYMRDAVASPALPMGAGGWFQVAGGAAALGRSAQPAALFDRLKGVRSLRPTEGRAVFSVRRAIVEHVRRGVPGRPSRSSGSQSPRESSHWTKRALRKPTRQR